MILKELARIALYTAPLIGLLLVARPWLKRWIGGRGLAFVWAVIALRLLIPVVWSIPQTWNAQVREVVERKEAIVGGKAVETPRSTSEMAQSGASPSWDWFTLASGVWLGGTALFGVWLLCGAVRLWRMKTGEVRDEALLAAWAGIDSRLRGKMRLQSSAIVPAPALVAWGGGRVGFSIWVPEHWRLKEEQWRHVLLHELGHYHRGDLWLQWLGMLSFVIHWWNPLVGWMTQTAERDREVACDEWVRQRLKDEEAYGVTLITLARWMKRRAPLPGAVLMASGKRQLEERVEAIALGRVAAAWPGIMLASVVLLGATITTAKAEREVGRSVRDWTSETEQQVYRKEKHREYREILRYGGLAVESRLYEIPRSAAPKLSQKIFGSEAPTVGGVTVDQVRLLDRSISPKNCLSLSMISLSERLNRRSKETKVYNREIAWGEIVRELRHFYEYDRREGRVIPLKSQSTPVGYRFGVKNWKHLGDLIEFGVTIELRELIGWHHFLDQKSPYRQTPWKKGLLNRVGGIPEDPQDFATPIFSTFRIETSSTLFTQVPNYILFRLKPFSTIIHPNGEHYDQKPEESSFPNHPIYDQEYWVVVRVEVIRPEKPPTK